ncbi:MAG: hypothetical protein ABIT47_03020 [Candidatus Paceibacterota bacterium]
MTTTQQTSSLLEALNIGELEPAEQEEFLLDINELVFKGSLIRMIEGMDEKTKDSFNALLDTDPSEEEMEAFLAEHVPDADLAVQETLDELTNDILAATGPVTS